MCASFFVHVCIRYVYLLCVDTTQTCARVHAERVHVYALDVFVHTFLCIYTLHIHARAPCVHTHMQYFNVLICTTYMCVFTVSIYPSSLRVDFGT